MRVWLLVAMIMLLNSWLFGQGVIGIWCEPSVPKQKGHADPQRLVNLLRRNGFSVRLLSSSDLSNPHLTPQKIAIIILPYGPHFPANAVENFRRYLKSGGKFVSLGGYAFDEVYERDGGRGTIDGLKWEKAAHEKVQVSITQQQIRIAVPDDVPVDWHRVRAFVSLKSGWRYMLMGKIRTDGIANGHGAYLAADYFDADGNRISFQQTQIVKQTKGWQELGVVLSIPKDTAKVAINAIVHGHGVAEFADISVKPIINARWGDARDALHIDPEQFAIFDPSFRIDGATLLERNTTQREKDKVVLQTKEPMEGYAAVALIGSNNPVNPQSWARLVPVLIARDKFGRYLGPAFSILHHFAGPYAGSTWAFCGIESHDLTKSPKFQAVLIEVVRHMLRGVYLHSLRPSLWTYRKGETASISVKVRNDGLAPQTVTVRIEVAPMAQPLQMGKSVVLGEKTVTISPREQTTVTMNWHIPQNAVPLYVVRAVLNVPTHIPHSWLRDEIWSGFCVWDERVLQDAKPIAWRNNILHEWMPERLKQWNVEGLSAEELEELSWQPIFLLGTNQTGVMFAPEATWENPLQWEFEFALMRKMGLKVLRVLHISHFAGDLENPNEEFWRRYDALVLMTHRHGLILMPTLHEWMGVSVSDELLRKQCAFVRLVGARYKNAPRIIWDIENEAWVDFRNHPDLHRLFNEWLRQRYGSDEKLQEAWRENVKLGEVRYAEHKPRGWDDLKFRDIQHFRRWLIERWVKANVEALRESGAKQPVTDEIDWKVCGDHYEATKWLDFVNLHYYGNRSPNAIATYLKFHDRRARKQGLAVGEFGARDHPSFRFGGWGYASTEEVIRHFVNLPLLTLGLQGTMVLNWDWKDMEACIFPWGLVHQHGIYATVGTRDAGRRTRVWQVEGALKVSGKTFAAVAKLLDSFLEGHELTMYREPRRVKVVVPDEHLLGPEGEVRWSGLGPAGRISAAVFNAIEALMRLKVSFNVVREWELAEQLEKLEPPQIAVFPIPFVWSKRSYETVKSFVGRGGIAVITGDFTFDLDRKRTETERLKDLLGLEFISGVPSPFELDKIAPVRCVATEDEFALQEWWGKPCVKAKQKVQGKGRTIVVTEKGEPVVIANKLGKGLVLFCADAPEFRSVDETMKVYKALLQRAVELGVDPKRTEWVLGGWAGFGKEPDLLMFGQEGSWIFVTANLSLRIRDAHFFGGAVDWFWRGPDSRLTMLPNWVGFLATGSHGESEVALTAGDFWGIGLSGEVRHLVITDRPTMVQGIHRYAIIGYPNTRFIPLFEGKVKLAWVKPTASLTVCDLVTGKVLLRRKVRAKDGWLQFDVPPELTLTEWKIEE